jgi:hypothetical protein
MTGRNPLTILAVVLSIATATGCHGDLVSVPFRDAGGVPVSVREEPGTRPEEEGIVASDPWETPKYVLEEPLLITSEAPGLVVRYSGTSGSPTVRLYGPGETVLLEEALVDPSRAGRTVEVFLPLSPGSLIGAIRFAVPCRCGRFELESVAVAATPHLYRISRDIVSVAHGITVRSRNAGSEITLPESKDALKLTVSGSPIDSVSAEVLEPDFRRPHALLRLSGPDADGVTRSVALRVYPRNRETDVYLYSTVTGVAPRSIEIAPGTMEVEVREVAEAPAPTRLETPIPAEPWTILTYPIADWRSPDLEVFEWSAYPGIYVIDFVDYAVQSDYFKRLSFFTEKRGFRGRMPSVAEVASRHGWNAHNYSAAGLAAFFQAAADGEHTLTAGEASMQELAVNLGLVRRSGDRFEAGDGGIVSITRESSPILRELLMAHEAFHGVFYARPAFRRFVDEYWRSQPELARSFWRGFFSYMTYDPADEYLMVNELQGYILQQRPRAVNWYFTSRIADRLARAGSPASVGLQSLLAAYPRYFWDTSAEINRYVLETENLLGGAVYGIEPVD